MHLWHLNNMKVILTLQALRYVDCIPFLYWFFIMFIIEPSIFKKFYFPLSENHDQTSIDLNNVFEFNMIVHLYQKIYYMKIYNKVTIWVSELILTSYSSFDMKCIKPNVKKPRVALNHGQCPLIPIRIFVDQVTIFSTIFMQHWRWSSLWQKIGNGWKLLLTVVT